MSRKELLPVIPAIQTKKNDMSEAIHYGAGNYVYTLNRTNKNEYDAYLEALSDAGFEKYVDNGANGLDGAVYNAVYQKDSLVVTVTHAVRPAKIYISVCKDLPLSDHLIYKSCFADGIAADAQTELYMREMFRFGNSFVFRLKNGHFIISDGGLEYDCKYMLDFLESLTPEGEKPVVEAWFFTHGHGDHVGIMGGFVSEPKLAERIFVEGVYFNEPSREVMLMDRHAVVSCSWVISATMFMKTTSGEMTKVYRPQTGQRYYFCDITVDIVHGQEQLAKDRYSGDFNDSSTWCMFTIDGQKLLFTGDGEKGGMETLMETYSREYLTVDMMTVMHHSYNTRYDFTEYCTVNTALFSLKDNVPVRRTRENEYLKARVKEWFTWGQGGLKFVFPYQVGEAERMPLTDWKYHVGVDRGEQPNLYTAPQGTRIVLRDHGYTEHARVFRKTVLKKVDAEFVDRWGLTVDFAVDANLGPAESYEIVPGADGFTIIGADEAGLYYGIGKFLHTTKWMEENFIPNPPLGMVTPNSSFRAMYFSAHFYNWYQMASVDELEDYVEHLLLWGYNTIIGIVPVINLESFDEPLAYELIEKVRRTFLLCRRVGMQTGLIVCPNQGLKTAPPEFDSTPDFNLQYRGNIGRNICVSKPGAMDYLRTVWQGMMKPFMDIGLDYIITWPYDEGGCGCKDCRPWGAVGYGNACIAYREEALKLYPNVKFVVATWTFDVPESEGEYEGFYARLKTDLSWIDYIMVDAHEEYPRYPLEHEVIKPVVNFPEIAMWKLFPWGGLGANPLPKRFQRIWDDSKAILKGGMPYSEGKYEDISKIQCVGYYWDPERTYEDILGEYIGFEYDQKIKQEVLTIMELIEENHVGVAEGKEPNLAAARKAYELACQVNAGLRERIRNSWRWRILYIRTIIDKKRFEAYEALGMNGAEALENVRHLERGLLDQDPEAQILFWELCKEYGCVDYNGENHATHPPVYVPGRRG